MTTSRPRKPFRERFAAARVRLAESLERFAERSRTADRRRLFAALEKTPVTSEWVILEVSGVSDMSALMHDGWEVVSHSPPFDATSSDRYVMRKKRKLVARDLAAG